MNETNFFFSPKKKRVFVQGDELEENEGIYRANYWQGKFPDEDMGSDGYQYKTAAGNAILGFFVGIRSLE